MNGRTGNVAKALAICPAICPVCMNWNRGGTVETLGVVSGETALFRLFVDDPAPDPEPDVVGKAIGICTAVERTGGFRQVVVRG